MRGMAGATPDVSFAERSFRHLRPVLADFRRITGLLHASCRRAPLDWLGLKFPCTRDWSGWETCSGDATLAKPRQCRRSARVPSLLRPRNAIGQPGSGMGDRADGQGLNLTLSVLDESGRRSAPARPQRPGRAQGVCQRLLPALSPSAMAVFSLSTMYAHRH